MKHLELILKKLEASQTKTTRLIKDADKRIEKININKTKFK